MIGFKYTTIELWPGIDSSLEKLQKLYGNTDMIPYINLLTLRLESLVATFATNG